MLIPPDGPLQPGEVALILLMLALFGVLGYVMLHM